MSTARLYHLLSVMFGATLGAQQENAMAYMTVGEWIMFIVCMALVLPWLLGGLLVVNDFKQRRKRDRA